MDRLTLDAVYDLCSEQFVFGFDPQTGQPRFSEKPEKLFPSKIALSVLKNAERFFSDAGNADKINLEVVHVYLSFSLPSPEIFQEDL